MANYSISDAINLSIQKRLLDMWTCIPASVVSYDSAAQTITAKVSVQRRYVDGKSEDFPSLSGVPIVWPRGASGGFTWEVKAGDQVALFFSQRSLDQWKRLGKGYPPSDTRMLDLSDAIAVPGLFPSMNPYTPPPKGGADVRGNTVNISKSGNPTEPAVLGSKLQKNLEDLIQAVNDLVTLLGAPAPIGTVSTGAGSGGTVVSTIVTTAVVLALNQVKAALPTENSQIIKVE